jgi:hypothetical protein
MQNIRQLRIEKVDWSKHWKKFTEWEMHEGSWKEETKFLEKSGIRQILGDPQIVDMG